jgi:hypothetical protein
MPAHQFLTGTLHHLLFLIFMVPAVLALGKPPAGNQLLFGLDGMAWFRLGVAVPVAHQVVVWLGFRGQLCFRIFTRLFGRLDIAAWGLVFLPLLVLRVISLVGSGLTDRGSLGLNRAVAVPAGLALLGLAFYTLWSVFRYFGLARALGADHFRAEYCNLPFEKRGAFRLSNNAMYTFAFLGLWGAALLLDSRNALALAAFQHAYIWVHWYCVEAPDMDFLYKRPGSGD